jgi:Holliday junction resolvasome RuvABC endonuclease subunit
MNNPNTSAKHYIGVDPSLNGTGLAVLTDMGGVFKRATLLIAPHKSLTETAKLLYIYRTATEWLTAIIAEGAFPVACMEGPSYGSVGRQDILGEVRGVLKLVLCQLHAAPIIILAPATLKKFASGYGAADKEQVGAGMRTFGWFAHSSDEYDAAALAEYCYAQRNENATLTRPQREALNPKKKPTRRWTKSKGINI